MILDWTKEGNKIKIFLVSNSAKCAPRLLKLRVKLHLHTFVYISTKVLTKLRNELKQPKTI